MGRGGFEPPKALGQLIYSQSRLTTSVSARPRNFTENNPMGKRRWIMWQGLNAPSLERCIVTPRNHGIEFDGLILQAHKEVAYVVRYRIRVDEAWTTREVELELENGGSRTLSLMRNAAGHWWRDGQRLNRFDDCVDVDLEWSPSTNTLPIRRLDLAIGQTAPVTAAWIQLPFLEIQRLDQSYERLAVDRYRYRSGSFTADLAVDLDGVVLEYGVNWKAVATSGELVTSVSTSAGPVAGTGH